MSRIIYKNNNRINNKLPNTYEKVDWHDDYDTEHIRRFPNYIYGLYVVNNDENVEEHWFNCKRERDNKLTKQKSKI